MITKVGKRKWEQSEGKRRNGEEGWRRKYWYIVNEIVTVLLLRDVIRDIVCCQSWRRSHSNDPME